MPRVKRGVAALRKRKKILSYTKGFQWSRKSKERAAREALLHAWSHAFRGRKEKKRNFRSLWQVKINAAAKRYNLSYGVFMHKLLAANIRLDRKVLSDLAEHEPEVFRQIIEKVSK